MFAVVVLAALVVLSGCQGAVGKAGPAGPAGEPGTTGTTGTPGTTDNAPPTLKTPFKTVYLALGGTGVKTTSDPITLSAHFTDVEAQSLDFKAASTNKTVATAAVAAGKLTITALTVGTTSVTVSVYDSVNDPVTATIPVTVVAVNEKPTVSWTGEDTVVNGVVTPGDTTALQKKLFVSSGTVVTTISAVVNSGAAGTLVDLPTPVVAITTTTGVKVADADAIVSVAVAPGTKPNTWDVSITPLKPGVTQVRIDVADIFGVEAEEDIKAKPAVQAIPTANPTVEYVPAVTALVNAPIVFMATVNTPPTLGPAMPDKILVHNDGDNPVLGVIEVFTYTVATYFKLDDKSITEVLVPPAEGSDDVLRDDVCVFSTNPVQPATVAATSMALITRVPEAATTPLTAVTVNAGGDALATGTITLTITCSDAEASVSSSATITVRP